MARLNLLHLPTHDGGRQFAALPRTIDPMTLRDHIAVLPGAEIGSFVYSVSESWIDFALEGHTFSVNDQFGEYWFFVANPDTPDELLERVVSHAATLLGDLAEGRNQTDRRNAAFTFGLTASVSGVLLLWNAGLSWSILASTGLALFAAAWWLATIVLRWLGVGGERSAPLTANE